MKLILEYIDLQDIKVLKEDCASGGCHSSKKITIEGPFLQAEVENKNKRKYKLPLIEREVKKYNEEKISKHRALGELDHSNVPQINLDRVSHLIESLEMKGNIGYGSAKLLDTPTGRIAKTLIMEGVVLGVSTRGIGTIDENSGYVNDDFQLLGVDIVSDPSAPKAFVEAVMENKEWILEGNRFVEMAIEKMERNVHRNGSKVAFEAMNEFLTAIRNKI
jgi:hypothetical protein